jgi:tungstate transport system permease protein
MIIAQILIIFPIVSSLSHEIFFQNWKQYKDQFRSLNMPFFGIIKILTIHSYFLLVTVILSAFGRAISEVGAVMIVGGNIDHYTRVMTTAISLETRMGNLEYAMALGIILIFLTMAIYTMVYLFNLKKR